MESGLFDLHSTGIDGVNLIEASAGTGKTYAIEGLFLRLLLEQEIRVENILVVTFTEAATAELRQRISGRIRAALDVFQQQDAGDDFLRRLVADSTNPERDQDRLKLALAGFDEAAIYTIHGFSLKMLNDFAFESQSLFEMEFQGDQAGLLSELAADYWRSQLYGAEKGFVETFVEDYPSPQALAFTAIKMHSRPVEHLLPGMAATDPRHIYRDIATRFNTMRDRWKIEQQNVRSLLHGNGYWHKKYQENLDLYLEQITCFFESNRPFVNWKCLLNLTPEVMSRKTKKGGAPPEHPLFVDFARFTETISRFAVAVKLDFIRYADRELTLRKQQRNLRSFDDLLQDLHRVLASRRGLELAAKMRRKFAVVLVDEFQDTDPVQYEIFRAAFMGGSPRLFFIGDPKQSIYSFRGADIYAYLRAENDADRKLTLPVNYRSDQDLVQAINTIFCCRADPFAEGRIHFSPVSGSSRNPQRSLLIDGKPQVPMHMWYRFAAEHDAIGAVRRQIAEAVASRIVELLNLGVAGRARLTGTSGSVNLQPKDMAVLVRTHKEAGMMKAALADRRVPAVLHVNTSIFESDEFRDICALAEAVADFRREYKVRSVLVSEVLGGSGTELYQWIHDEGRWEDILSNFRRYHEIWAASGFQQMMVVLLQQEQVREKLLRRSDGERRLTNVLHVMEVFHQAETESSLTMGGLLRWANSIRQDGQQQDQYQIRLETDADAVKISTVHTSKGLEFPLVFIPFSWGRRDVRDCFFHDPHNNYALTWDLEGGEQSKLYAQQEDLAENLRLFYVALTRAKHCCHVVWGDIPRTKNSCYTYLFHPDPAADRWSDLQQLQEDSGGTIKLEDLPVITSEVYVPPGRAAVDLTCRERRRSLVQDWGVSSFSGISARKKDPYEGLDHDHRQPPVKDTAEIEQEAVEPGAMFSFPGGVRTGNCFHEIFEDLFFGEQDQEKITELVRKKLSKYDFDPVLVPTSVQLVGNVLNRQISPTSAGEGVSFSLARLEAAQVVKEMGFHFPITALHSRTLVEQVAAHCRTPSHHGLLQSLQQLEFIALKGFMKGFIDLVFCHEERFYILDWKTNVLGDHLSDYTPDKLQQTICDHLFNLQYYIYTVALHKYLKLRMPDTYDFDRHFGGVFYFFLRGISAENTDTGVFHDALCGSREMIELLEKVFSGDAP